MAGQPLTQSELDDQISRTLQPRILAVLDRLEAVERHLTHPRARKAASAQLTDLILDSLANPNTEVPE